MNDTIPQNALALAGLAVEYCKTVTDETLPTRELLREVLRYLPRIYITISDIQAFPEDNEAVYSTVGEEQYTAVAESLARILGEYDTYLDTAVDDMQYSDTPVAVNLSEQLADIYQAMGDTAAAIGQATPELIPEIFSDIKYKFNEYLSDIICAALKAANYTYCHATFEDEEDI